MTEPRRVRPPAIYDGHAGVLDKLTAPGLFETKQAALMFAAAVGKLSAKPDTIDRYGEGIRWQIFERNQDAGYVYALALAEFGSVQVLARSDADSDDPIAIFEGYVAAGLRIIAERVFGRPGDPLDMLLGMIAESRQQEREPAPGLEGLSPSTLDILRPPT